MKIKIKFTRNILFQWGHTRKLIRKYFGKTEEIEYKNYKDYTKLKEVHRTDNKKIETIKKNQKKR